MNRLNNFTNEEIIFLIQAISYINRHFVDTIEESRNLYLELLEEEKKEVYKGGDIMEIMYNRRNDSNRGYHR